MKAVVAAFNQEKALVGAFSVITNLRMELFQALSRTCRRWRGARAAASSSSRTSAPATAASGQPRPRHHAALTSLLIIRRTCTDRIDINLWLVHHGSNTMMLCNDVSHYWSPTLFGGCMSEGGGRGHLCFCEEDDCNLGAGQHEAAWAAALGAASWSIYHSLGWGRELLATDCCCGAGFSPGLCVMEMLEFRDKKLVWIIIKTLPFLL